jgi:putative transposase
MRKQPLVTGKHYHIYTKTIAGFKIFNQRDDFLRLRNILRFAQSVDALTPLSQLLSLKTKEADRRREGILSSEKQVEIIAYCIMPTHVHFFLKQLREEGISRFMNRTLLSYTRFFNLKHKRKGPLWESRFQSVPIENDTQAIHLTRYIHLNPATAGLVKSPDEWEFSSYHEYICEDEPEEGICKYKDLFDLKVGEYKKFVSDRAGYQRELARIKGLILETDFN